MLQGVCDNCGRNGWLNEKYFCRACIKKIKIKNNKKFYIKEIVMFNAVKEITDLANEIEGKIPTQIIDVLDNKCKFFIENGITQNMHIGKTDWTKNEAAEWLLSMFLGIVEKGKEDQRYFNAFGSWLTHVYHFVINNEANLPEE